MAAREALMTLVRRAVDELAMVSEVRETMRRMSIGVWERPRGTLTREEEVENVGEFRPDG